MKGNLLLGGDMINKIIFIVLICMIVIINKKRIIYDKLC